MTSLTSLKKNYWPKNKPLSDIEFTFVNSRQGKICDDIICFDIETTSAFLFPDGRLEMFDKNKSAKEYKTAVKVGLCYLWKCAINYNIFTGRTLESFAVFLDDLREVLDYNKAILYVHNLSFETAFLMNVLEGIEVFARKKRKPIYFRWQELEFRCSYMLTRLSLKKWAEGKNLAHQKKVGDLDYNVMRTPLTIITDIEDGYADADVLVMVDGLQEYKERFDHVYNIPITQTGIVRREFNSLMHDEHRYQLKMKSLVPNTLPEYEELVHIFGGGLTRANRLLAGETLENVRSRDKASAYPWAMISKKYPMSKFRKRSYNIEYYMGDDCYSYIIDVEFYDIKSIFWNTYLSKSKCTSIQGGVYDNFV